MRRINENRNLITKRSKPEEFSATFIFRNNMQTRLIYLRQVRLGEREETGEVNLKKFPFSLSFTFEEGINRRHL